MTTDTLEALREAREAAAFLLERLTEHENRLGSVDDARQFHGHVAPAAARLHATLSRIDAAIASDHIGNSTTMVPTLGVEGVAQIIRQHLNAPVSSCALLDIDEAARAIIAAMEKNDG